MRELDSFALEAKSDPSLLDKLIRQQEGYILKCASKTCHRYVTKSDDEWSIALIAFTQAVENYDLEKGSFLSFVDLVIKRRLIDYIKSRTKYNYEISVDPIVFDTEPEEESDDPSLRVAVAEQVSKQDSNDLKWEIEAANHTFAKYGFTFYELSDCSPHAAKTRKACAAAVNYMLHNPLLLGDLRSTKQLPLKIIEKGSHVPRKILERHRKYIIAAIEILSGEYPYLADYLRYIREER
ncbi:MAG: polymerase, sigma 28 subunit, FliA/WhiG subfamily [Herbinix sp.]|jgi:RNA polymerase sigma factor|nr:polymerase, sigma 28 subunit, FliA/WhiG subfamily [Herbinix sp.]